MKIRRATADDTPAIIELLKLSLGESLMPKSEAYWLWKHVNNPFGASPVLLAEENEELIGIRAFMRWEWRYNHEIYRAVRAVDTATHPGYQGRGIFKKLTLQLVEECEREGIHFVFNTPNNQSRPGYLKMDWKEAGRLPVCFRLVNPLMQAYSQIRNVTSPALSFSQWSNTPEAASVWRSLETRPIFPDAFVTNVTKDYLLWRYKIVPVVTYHVVEEVSETEYEILIYRLKRGSLGTELRITDYITNRPTWSEKIYRKLIESAYSAGARYITYSGAATGWRKGLMLKKGPVVTVRKLAFDELNHFDNFKNWQPSLGDLELF